MVTPSQVSAHIFSMAVEPACLYRFFRMSGCAPLVDHRRWSAMSAITQEYQSQEIEPARSPVLGLLGIPSDTILRPEIEELFAQAIDLFHQAADPRGISEAITLDEFASIHPGEGLNDPETPLETIWPQSERLALFAVTLGPEVSETITGLFDRNEFAFATIFDAVASEGADSLAEKVMQGHLETTGDVDDPTAGRATLRYSPGYCGWHVSAQRSLFPRLRPEQIGITLLDSCLMTPSKSISGVMVTGRADIHRFDPDFAFCADCATKGCRDRIATLDIGSR